jgi:PAS domain S-box-containing protein
MFDRAPEGLLVTGAKGKIQEANHFAARLLQTPRRGLVGRELPLFVCREQRRSFRSKLSRLRRAGSDNIREWEIRLQPPGNDPIETVFAVTPLEPRAPRPNRLVCAVRDITRRKRIESRLKESERQHRSLYRRMLAHRDALRVLSARYLHAREEEAKRIAHQLHDEAGQVTASIHLALAEIARDLPARGRQRLRQVEESLDDIENRLRGLSHELRPMILDDFGLTPALEFLAEGFSSRTGIAIRVEGSTKGRLDPLVETTIYRVVQEALANIARHAHARRASILVGRDGPVLSCVVRDDGVGFDAAHPRDVRGGRGLGLLGVRERLDAVGGRIRIRSAHGAGTHLFVSVPLRGRP